MHFDTVIVLDVSEFPFKIFFQLCLSASHLLIFTPGCFALYFALSFAKCMTLNPMHTIESCGNILEREVFLSCRANGMELELCWIQIYRPIKEDMTL